MLRSQGNGEKEKGGIDTLRDQPPPGSPLHLLIARHQAVQRPVVNGLTPGVNPRLQPLMRVECL